MTQRYGSSMVFMSLLLSTELGVLFNSAPVTSNVREALLEGNHTVIQFWAGFFIMISALLTILSLIALFTAWGMVNSIDEVNMHCIFRSSIGQYAAELPGRLIVCSIYAFLISFMMFFFLLLPFGPWSITLSLLAFLSFIHIVSTFSAFGRIIMHTGAMGSTRIFSSEDEDNLLPRTLHSNLLKKAQANLASNASIIRQYRRKPTLVDHHYQSQDNLFDSGTDWNLLERVPPPDSNGAYRPRVDSTVRFTDLENVNDRGDHRSQHFSTLTPLSDGSSEKKKKVPSPPRNNGPGQSSLKRSSYGGPRPSNKILQRQPTPRELLAMPPPTPLPHLAEVSSSSLSPHLAEVSSSSLTQWLQNSESESVDTPPFRVVVAADQRKDGYTLQSSPGGALDEEPLDVPSFLIPSGAGSIGASTTMVSTPADSSLSNQRTPSHSELSQDDRHLSEDEQFALDYGDFEADNNDANGRRSASSSPLRLFDDDVVRSPVTNHIVPENDGTERQSLLGTMTSPPKYYSVPKEGTGR